MVVDAVICHWVTLVAGEEAEPDVFGWAVQWLLAFFYADDGLPSSPRPARIQEALDVLMGLFNWVFIQTNIYRTVGMVLQRCYIVGRHLEMAYTWRMTGLGPSFWESQKERVWYPEYELELVAG